MQLTPAEQKLLEMLRDSGVQYGEVRLECTYTKGRLAKVVVVDKKQVVLMD